MTKIKICGLMRDRDVDAVNAARPDYAGFVFAERRHRLTAEEAARLVAHLNPSIRSVGVFVNASAEAVADVARTARLDVLQLHGEEPAETAEALRRVTSCEIWKAVRMKPGEDVPYRSYPADRFLLDAFSRAAYGGTGTSFDWRLLDGLPTGELILAGGIRADNVRDVVERYRPFAVDVSSGAETDGQKDPEKIRQIVRLVREADKKDQKG